MKAAIYCRVSTDSQEREGTSLQTQLENCLIYCQGKGYDVSYRFSEAFSGLSLERPALDKLRELVRTEAIDIVVCYSLDRLSRDPGHGVILTQELESHQVGLETVTETLDSTEIGKLISYIRGYASKVEAEKIRERTIRGKRARAKEGRLPTGGAAIPYGYDYIKDGDKGGRRVINEIEAGWVKKIFEWCVDEGLSNYAIASRLKELGVPTKKGKQWAKETVRSMLKNTAYIGKTYAFKTKHGQRIGDTPRDGWIEILKATPPIVDSQIFDDAQKQLSINSQKAMRNTRHLYLLRGHIRCQKCGCPYVGHVQVKNIKGKRYEYRRYECTGRYKYTIPSRTCTNKSWNADNLESLVWEKVEHIIANPEIIINEIERQRQDSDKSDVLTNELQHVERHLKALKREQEQLLRWALKGFPEDTIVLENKRINEKRESLKAQKAELESQIISSQEARINVPKLESLVELFQQEIANPDFETRRLAMEMLNIKVWVDELSIEITGSIPIPISPIATTLSV
ncbi:recombinase family protein [Chloroflexota bacterium]